MATKHVGAKTVRIRSQVSLMEGDKPSAVHFNETTVFNPTTGILRSWALNDSDQRLYGMERKLSGFTLPDELLLDPQANQITNILLAKGIPIFREDELSNLKTDEERRKIEKTSLFRWKGSAAWVLGREQKDVTDDDGKPQLWIEKDGFVALRTANLSGLPEFQFEGYRYYRDFPYPQAITLVKSGQPQLRDQVIEVNVNTDAGDLKGPTLRGYTDVGNASPGAVRDLIQSYYEDVR